MFSPRIILPLCLALIGSSFPADAIILYRTGDPRVNTTAPSGGYSGSGWQYEGQWGAFLGTVVAPQFFVSANHIGNAGSGVFNFNGVSYSVTESHHDAFSDLILWRVNGTFPTIAPLYSTNAEVGQKLVAIGRGTQRGSAVLLNGQSRGWYWGTYDAVQRWGDNIVSAIVNGGTLNDYVHATFDASGKTPNECHLSSGDSGGAMFIQDNGVWKLAGIHYAVDGPFYTSAAGDGAFNAALFDTRGFYSSDTGAAPFNLITAKKPVPSGLYSTRISTKLSWIHSITDPTGDADGNGVPNLLQYARELNTAPPAGVGVPVVANGNGVSTITYTKIVDSSLTYTVQQSTDQVNWTTAATQDQVTWQSENVQTVQASVSNPSNIALYLRLSITSL